MKANFDAKRAQILKQIHADKMKAEAKAKKEFLAAAKLAEREQNIVNDAKID